ncbi:ABC transporter permease subunit [Fusibacter tunisiensis]|uniref:Branched-subunit amino acid ABC-type transport system permease component n=1 Tax=Fusibacter tunisiensis TaxID=1008308 RepID=A0ABS2MRN1_9FIRM|nr:branched-subunit amino acid ABC-type transport system permease component [Fusibacter tunisiensis]
MTFSTFFQHLSNGLALGSLYALIAIGYTMVYGILRLINFAHGDIFMISTYIMFYGVSLFFMPWWVALHCQQNKNRNGHAGSFKRL